MRPIAGGPRADLLMVHRADDPHPVRERFLEIARKRLRTI
jgi:hypothetical protein